MELLRALQVGPLPQSGTVDLGKLPPQVDCLSVLPEAQRRPAQQELLVLDRATALLKVKAPQRRWEPAG